MRKLNLHRTGLGVSVIMLGATLAACGGHGERAVVRIDMRALQNHAALAAVELDNVMLQVTAEDLAQPIAVTLEQDDSFVVQVPAGLARSFTLAATTEGVHTYWGRTVTDLVAGAEIDLLILAFPSGDLTGSVTAVDGTPVPGPLALTLTPVNPRPDFATDIEWVIGVDGTFAGALPTGEYQLAASYEVDGATYRIRVPSSVTITQGVNTDVSLLMSTAVLDLQAATVALGERDYRGALDLYRSAARADVGNVQAHAGAGLMSLLLVGESDVVDDFLLGCGENVFDVQGMLDRIFTHLADSRVGTSTVALHSQTDNPGGPLIETPIEFSPQMITAEQRLVAFGEQCTDCAAQNDIDVDLTDLVSGADMHQVSVGVSFNLIDGPYADAAVITSSDFGVSFDLREGPRDTSSADIYLESGTLQIVKAGSTPGSVVDIIFNDAVIALSEWDSAVGQQIVFARYRLSGQVTDVLDAEYIDNSAPFDSIVYAEGPPVVSEFVQILQACSVGGVDDMASALAVVHGLALELQSVVDHFAVVAAADQAVPFIFELPAGAVANEAAIPLSLVSFELVRGAVLFGLAANGILQQYDYFTPKFTELLGTLDPYFDDSGMQTTGTDFVPALMVAALNSVFLTHAADLDMTSAGNQLTSALEAWKTALSTTGAAGLFDPRKSAESILAADELLLGIDLILLSLQGDQALTTTPEYVLKLHHYLTQPFDKASLAASSGVTDFWEVLPPDVGASTSETYDLVEEVGDAILEHIMLLPAAPVSRTYCIDDAACAASAAYLICNGSDDVAGACSGDSSVACDPLDPNLCGSGDVGYCVTQFCEPRAPEVFDLTLVTDNLLTPDGEPTALNSAAIDGF